MASAFAVLALRCFSRGKNKTLPIVNIQLYRAKMNVDSIAQILQYQTYKLKTLMAERHRYC